MPRVLLIALSATIRHIGSHFLIKMGYEVDVERDFESALMRLAFASKAGSGYEAVVLGSPEPDIVM